MLVLGNAGIDLVLDVPHLPRAGETVVGGALRRAPGGKGLNQAVMAARAGAAVSFCAPLGDDEAGGFVAAALEREGFASLSLPRPGPSTDVSIITVAPGGENCIVSAGDCAAALPDTAAAEFASRAAAGDVLLLQGNLSLSATLAAARPAAARGARVLLNPAPLRWAVDGLLPLCWGVVANAGEASDITGAAGPAAAAALAAAGPALAVVTLGGAGCACVPGGLVPAPAVRAVDTTGAGDVFCGVLAAALARGLPVPAAVAAAQDAAADSVTRPGAFAAFPPRVLLPA